jgi:hypothetical protein
MLYEIMSRMMLPSSRLPLLLVILIAFGLATVPVECSVAIGPHSIFIAADDVVALQDAAAADGLAAHLHSTGSMPPASHDADGMATGRSDGMPSTATTTNGHSTPAPAGVAMDAIVAMSMPDTRQDLGVTGALTAILGDLLLPPGRLLPAPEPPPP